MPSTLDILRMKTFPPVCGPPGKGGEIDSVQAEHAAVPEKRATGRVIVPNTDLASLGGHAEALGKDSQFIFTLLLFGDVAFNGDEMGQDPVGSVYWVMVMLIQ